MGKEKSSKEEKKEVKRKTEQVALMNTVFGGSTFVRHIRESSEIKVIGYFRNIILFGCRTTNIVHFCDYT